MPSKNTGPTVKGKGPCPDGGVRDAYGNCWNFKMVATLVRGAPCQESFEIPFRGDPGPLDEEMLRVFLKSPQYRETLKQLKEMSKLGSG